MYKLIESDRLSEPEFLECFVDNEKPEVQEPLKKLYQGIKEKKVSYPAYFKTILKGY